MVRSSKESLNPSSLHENNLVNLQAAHGRIMDVDVAMESTRLARHSVTVQASAAMVAQANQMTAIALNPAQSVIGSDNNQQPITHYLRTIFSKEAEY